MSTPATSTARPPGTSSPVNAKPMAGPWKRMLRTNTLWILAVDILLIALFTAPVYQPHLHQRDEFT